MAWIKAYFDGFQIFEILVRYLLAQITETAVRMRNDVTA